MVTSSLRLLVLLAFSLCSLVACASDADGGEGMEGTESGGRGESSSLFEDTGPLGDPQGAFRELERRLLEADRVAMPLHITAKGAVSADLKGRFSSAPEHGEVLEARGSFSERPATIGLYTENGRLKLEGPQGLKTIDRPVATRKALLLGLIRMGFLHNIAMLIGGFPPDGASGDFSGLAETTNHRFVADLAIEGHEARALRFDLVVRGNAVGEATLWFDPRDGRLIERQQVVRFEEGDMEVVERYVAPE